MVGIKGRSGRRGGMLIGGESVHVRLPPGVMRKVEGQAAKDGMTVSEWIRRCIVTSVISKDLPIQPQVNRTMQPFYAIMGEVFRRALEEDPQLLQRMQTGLDRAIKDQLQELANQGVIPTKESKRKKEAQY
jgi:hypothetical protein